MKVYEYIRCLSQKMGAPRGGGIVDRGLVDLGARHADDMPDLKSFIAAGMPGDVLQDLGQAELALSDVDLLPVIPMPDKIVLAALNYWEDDSDREKGPAYPVLFQRWASSQIGHGAALIQPRSSRKLDFEGELAVIIGTGGRHIPADRAMAHVAGYSIYNDASVRDWQKHSHQFTPGKNFSGTGAFGPWMVQARDLPIHDKGVSLVTRVNGIEKQRTNTSQMIFDIPYLISFVSTFAPLEPGDVIVTGTCTGFPILRGSSIGSFFGALPGTGAAIASFMAYAMEKRFSRTPEKFGKGHLPGLAAPESANNAASQTGFIPTLTLGVPGDAVMALIIGALILNGIIPGPRLMVDQPELFWGVIASFFVGNIILPLINIPLIELWVLLLRIPYQKLYPMIVVMICVGV